MSAAIRNIILLALSVGLVALQLSGCGGGGEEPQAGAENAAYVDSLLRAQVPRQKWVSPRAKEWFSEQEVIIERDQLKPEMVVDIVKWHRAEVSELASHEGYTTYPLVASMHIPLHIDSALAITVTELNTSPRAPEKIVYFPWRKNGVPLTYNPEVGFTALLDSLGNKLDSPNHFFDLCTDFVQLASDNPQIVLTNNPQWKVYRAVDSLVRNGTSDSLLARDAWNLYKTVNTHRVVNDIDSLPESLKFIDRMNELAPNWYRMNVGFNVFHSLPFLSDDTYYAQIDFLDSRTFAAQRVSFQYSKKEGFKTAVRQLSPPEPDRVGG